MSPKLERERAGEVLVRILNGVLFELAQQVRLQAVHKLPENDKRRAFMTQSASRSAMSVFSTCTRDLHDSDFTQVQASVFQGKGPRPWQEYCLPGLPLP